MHCRTVEAPASQELRLTAGDAVPGRESWRLVAEARDHGGAVSAGVAGRAAGVRADSGVELETAPFFLESEYAGQNLSEWAEAQGGGVKAAGGSQKPIARSRELGA